MDIPLEFWSIRRHSLDRQNTNWHRCWQIEFQSKVMSVMVRSREVFVLRGDWALIWWRAGMKMNIEGRCVV